MLEILTDNETRLMAENEELRGKLKRATDFCDASANRCRRYGWAEEYMNALRQIRAIIS